MHQSVQKMVDTLVYELKQRFEDRLRSVCVYGSALQDKPDHKSLKAERRDINVLILLDRLTPNDLEAASPLAKWWEKDAGSAPMLMSLEEWQSSSDVFALEYADIRDWHHVAYGEDLYNEVALDCDALRLVCELELHRKQIFLRQQLMRNADKPNLLLGILEGSINSLAALSRGVMRLYRPAGTLPQASIDVFIRLPEILPGLDTQPFLDVLALRKSLVKPPGNDIAPLYGRILTGLQALTTAVDAHSNTTMTEGAPA